VDKLAIVSKLKAMILKLGVKSCLRQETQTNAETNVFIVLIVQHLSSIMIMNNADISLVQFKVMVIRELKVKVNARSNLLMICHHDHQMYMFKYFTHLI